MTTTYQARYKDSFGEEAVMILNDGETLTMCVRGVRFRGNDFDGFEPQDVSDSAQLASFTFLHGCLCFCVIHADIPVPVVTPTGIVDGLLTFELELGEPLPRGQMDRERLMLQLRFDGQRFSSKGSSGWFEGEMLDIQGQLPSGTFMKSCINCAFSDYSPAGHGLFGCLACFRGNKAGCRCVSCKKDLFAVWATMTDDSSKKRIFARSLSDVRLGLVIVDNGMDSNPVTSSNAFTRGPTPYTVRAADQVRLAEEFGLHNCWQTANPDQPLSQTLRWTGDRTIPYHCDGIFVPRSWKDRLKSCDVIAGEEWNRLSDHNPVVACFSR